MTTNYRLIGKGTTDSNGVAHMDYSTSDGGSTWTDISSNPGYTGVGAGEIDLLASTDNPITAGSCQSKPYEVYDYINFDNGLDGDCSNIWTGNTEDLSRQSDGSLFSSTSARKLLSSALIHGDFEATFEVIGTGSPLFGVQDASSNMTKFYLYNDNWYYYKISRVGGVFTAKASSNGTTWINLTAQSSNVTSADCYFLFHNNSGTKSIKFKNVKIYPI